MKQTLFSFARSIKQYQEKDLGFHGSTVEIIKCLTQFFFTKKYFVKTYTTVLQDLRRKARDLTI